MFCNTAEDRPYYSSGSGSVMLRAWFSCNPFVPSAHVAKVTAPLEAHRVRNSSPLATAPYVEAEEYRPVARPFVTFRNVLGFFYFFLVCGIFSNPEDYTLVIVHIGSNLPCLDAAILNP